MPGTGWSVPVAKFGAHTRGTGPFPDGNDNFDT